jgi:uncharacterized protein
MKCPACRSELSAVTLAELTLDGCQGGCGGIWFDRGELAFDPPAPLLAQSLDELSAGRTTYVDLAQRRRCPRCVDSVLLRHYSSASRAVTIDECPTCAGVWLDNGELERIRWRIRQRSFVFAVADKDHAILRAAAGVRLVSRHAGQLRRRTDHQDVAAVVRLVSGLGRSSRSRGRPRVSRD